MGIESVAGAAGAAGAAGGGAGGTSDTGNPADAVVGSMPVTIGKGVGDKAIAKVKDSTDDALSPPEELTDALGGEAEAEAEAEADAEALDSADDTASRGQGGTSELSSTGPIGGSPMGMPGGSGGGSGGGGKDIAKAGAAGVAVGGATTALTAMAIINFLKMMAAMAQAAFANLAAMVMAVVSQTVTATVSFVVGIGASVASALGVTTVAGTVAAAGAALVSVSLLVGGLFVGLLPDSSQVVALDESCLVGSVQTAAIDSADPSGISAVRTTNAKTIYSVLSAWGMSDANIAGILGNWQAESGIDPTSVQTAGGEAYQMTGDKLTVAADTDNGIGLGQWTFGRNEGLRTFASTVGEEWWAVATQLSYMLSEGEGSNADIVRGMITNEKGSPGEAALYFHEAWERSADTDAMAQRRADYAEGWFALMGGWTIDRVLADSVLAQAGTSLGDANDNQAASAKSTCRELSTVSVALQDGGLFAEESQLLVDLYNVEGDAFLDGRYGNLGGPGSCGDDHAQNCVSFSTYFLNKYTTYQKYPRGNGIQTARTVSADTGKPLQTTPVAYSVGSGPGSGAAGHTFIVLGVEGDSVIVGEAGYCAFGGRVSIRSAAALEAQGWVFVDLSDMMLPADQVNAA